MSSVSEGATPGSQANTEPTHGFTGQELDPETGLYYYGGRYYDPELGRFISPDPFVQDPEDPQNLNRYSYVLNNPQSYIDPTGYFVEWLLGGAAAGVEVLELVKYATAVTVGSGAGGAAVSGAGWFSAGGWSLFGQGLQTLGTGVAAAWPAIQTGLGVAGAVVAGGAVGTACVAATLACGAAAATFAASADSLATGLHGILSGQQQTLLVERAMSAFGASPEVAAFSGASLGAIGSPGTIARQTAGSFSRVLGFSERTVMQKFMTHKTDFGLSGNWNKLRGSEFRSIVNQHINSPDTRIIQGTYRGNAVTHYLDPNSALNVIADKDGNFVSGWKLGPEQLKSVLGTGRLF